MMDLLWRLWMRLPIGAREWLARLVGEAALRRAQIVAAVHWRRGKTMPAPHSIHARTFTSDALRRTMPYTLLLPAEYDPAIAYPVLYLLHGAWSNHTEWATRTRLAAHAACYPLMIVCPEGENSCYVNGANGARWEDYLVDDLPAHIAATHRVHRGRAGQAIAGLSMGGFGAFNAGMRHPEQYCVVSTLSGAFMMHTRRPSPDDGPQFAAVLGPLGSPTRAAYDPRRVLAAAVRANRPAALPLVAMDVGNEDYPDLRATNRALHADLTSFGVPHTYRELPGGHTWDYWDREIPFTLRFVATALRLR